MARYLVTGCAGFIGSHLVEALVRRGDTVRGVDCFTEYYSRRTKEANIAWARVHPAFTLHEADLAEVPLAPLVSDVDGVFHLSAQPGVRASWNESFARYLRDNVLVTQRLIAAAAEGGVRVVMASSSSVYGDAASYPTPEDARPRPISPYGVTKLACERLAEVYARAFGADLVSLRYFTVYGPRQRPDMAFTRMISALLNGNQFHIFGTGRQSRDFTFVDDVVNATLRAMARGPRGVVYNVGGGHEASLVEVIDLCEELSGLRLNRVYEASAPGDVRRTASDTTLIRTELGWSPQTRLAEGLGDQLEWVDTSRNHSRMATA